MKTTIKNLILSAVLVVGGASCVDLDTAPYDRETDLTYWEEDPEAAVKALNTCYTYLGNMDEQLYCEAMTDNAYTKQPNDATQNIGNGSYSTADPYVKRFGTDVIRGFVCVMNYWRILIAYPIWILN